MQNILRRLTTATSESSFSESVASFFPTEDEAAKFNISNVKYALSVPNLCPLSICYADLLASRAAKAKSVDDAIPRGVEQHLNANLLYFIMLHQICELEGKEEYIDSLPSEVTEVKPVEEDDSESLWKVLDAMIIRERKAARRWSVAAAGGRRDSLRRAHAESKKSAWNVFWEHFRAEPAKTTGVHVADDRANLGGRVATKGIYPSVSRRIVQEWDGLDRQMSEFDDSPPNSAHSAFRQSWRSDGSAPRGSQQKEDIKTWGFVQEDPNATLNNSKGFAAKQSRGQAGGTPGTPQHTAARSNSRQRTGGEGSPRSSSIRGNRKNAGSHSGRGSSPTKTPKVTARIVPKLNLNQVAGPTSGPFSPKFRSWDDYKQREKIQQRTDIDQQTREFVLAASAMPQREISAPLREHRAAVEWRMGRGNHSGRDTSRPGALTERSRRIHLPTLVQRRGCETERGGLRGGLSVPPATFRRPWSRELRQLPPIVTTKPSAPIEKSAIQRYAQIVQNTGIHPQPASINFLVQMPPKMDIRGKGYGDDDLLALVAALPRDSSLSVEVFDMGENPRLTDKSACLVLHALAEGSLGTLQGLYLDHCRQLFRESISLCTMLLSVTDRDEHLKELQVLDLSGIAIPVQEYVELARAVQMHRKLRDVRLAETGLGRYDKAHAGRVIGLLVQSSKLQALDLGWNMLDAAACQTLGKGLVEHEVLKTLGLSSAGTSYDATLGGSPILVFLEFLSADYTLTKLDISNNALDHVAPLVLEYALSRHPVMQEIDVSSNPIGVSGKRSLLRLLACPQCPQLSKIVFNTCNSAGKEAGGPFDGDPSGCYTMSMSQPGYRAFLKLLLSRCAEGADAPPLPKLLRNAMYKVNGTQAPFNFKLLRKEKNVWEVPVCGELSFELSAAEMILGPESYWSADVPVVARVVEMYTKSRIRLPGGNKTFSLLCQVKNSKDQDELDGILQALGADFLLTPEQLQGLCTTKMKHAVIAHDLPGTLCKLLPCVPSMQDFRRVAYCMRTLNNLQTMHIHGSELLTLNLENPNGHYNLHLSSPADHAVAEKLLLLNRWELQVWKSLGRPDISQYGNSKNFRNTRLDDRKFVWSAEEWRLPYDELLSFDYASLRRPPENAEPLHEDKFQYIMRVLKDAISDGAVDSLTMRIGFDDFGRRTCGAGQKEGFFSGASSSVSLGSRSESRASRSESRASRRHSSAAGPTVEQQGEAQEAEEDLESSEATSQKQEQKPVNRLSDALILRAIRAVTPHFYISCRQCRECLCTFTEQSTRTELVVYLCQRVIDWPMNANLVHSKIDCDKWKDLTGRIGYVYCFPFFQPENYSDAWDLSMNEQRRVLHLLISLMVQEHPSNIMRPRVDWNGPSNSPEWDSFPSGLPLSWADWDNVPQQGYFECLYVCSGDNQRLKVRRKLANTVGGFTAMPEDQVELENSLKFWTVLGGVPSEVHHYLYFMVCNFKDLRTAFSNIDSNGDGELSLKEFVEGNKKCGFRLPPPDDDKSTEDVRRISEENLATPRVSKRKTVVGKEALRQKESKEEERVDNNLRAVYRFLDPNKDGSVSMREFFALEGMWRELTQTMWEFVDHCRSKFGSLDQAWDAADEDHNASLDSAEFEQLARDWHFDGPVAQVYMWLDEDGSNSVSKKEWLTLEKIVKPDW